MKRTIVTIDEDRCNGCGECVSACAEGALRIVDGKARLVKEDFCDGFGDCIGECPTGALKIEVRDAPAYDPTETRRHVAATGGMDAVRRFDEAAQRHDDPPAPPRGLPPFPMGGGGCPGSRMREAAAAGDGDRPTPLPGHGAALPGQVNRSELRQWPIQLHLVQPGAPFFRGKELVVMSTCAPLASADVHGRFLRGRSVVVACPKLDRTEGYVEKLAAILADPSIPRVVIVRMEVPCCGGLTAIAREAVSRTGRADLAADEITVTLDGSIAG